MREKKGNNHECKYGYFLSLLCVCVDDEIELHFIWCGITERPEWPLSLISSKQWRLLLLTACSVCCNFLCVFIELNKRFECSKQKQFLPSPENREIENNREHYLWMLVSDMSDKLINFPSPW